MATDKVKEKREEKKKRARDKAELLRKQEISKRLKPLLYSFVLWGAFMAIIYIPAIHDTIMDFFVRFVVGSAVVVGKIFFLPVSSAADNLISVAGYQMKVIFECTAYNFYLFALSLVIFGKWSLRDKLINFLIFIVSIFILNTFRFIVMGYVGKFFPQVFHQVHDYVWTVIFGLVVFILYIWRNDQTTRGND